ncbi:MAG: hypothetical protein Q8K58_04675 [Acidimicrobiales bacterium]|nr:hypothetical protein [Acidimicrobiales bacterium]
MQLLLRAIVGFTLVVGFVWIGVRVAHLARRDDHAGPITLGRHLAVSLHQLIGAVAVAFLVVLVVTAVTQLS